jgi:hypothetical protein
VALIAVEGNEQFNPNEFSLSLISIAALFVKVTANTLSGGCLCSSIKN